MDERLMLGSLIPTSLEVERSFSKLKKMWTKEKGFKNENLAKYMVCYGNSNL